MATAPNIEIYEVFEDKPSVKAGRLLSPDQFIAMAAAMSFVEDQLSDLAHKDVAAFVKLYRKHGKEAPAEALDVFARYCATCAECGILADRPDWKANPEDFSRGVRVFLGLVFFSGSTLDRDIAAFGHFGFRIFNKLIKDEIENWDKPLPWPLRAVRRLLRVVFYPLGVLYRRRQPAYCTDGSKAMMIAGREALAKVIDLCRMASQDGRVFAFDPPEDQIETRLDLGELKISTQKDGGIVFGG